jgi:IclR family KDG regulon transcriptional repressor
MADDETRYKTLKDFSRILSLFEREETEEQSVSSISKSLHMLPSKVSRMLKTMEVEGLFEKNRDTGKYRIGSRFLQAGRLYALSHPLRRVILPHLEQVAREQNLLTGWAILRNGQVIVVDRLGFDRSPPIHLLGSTLALHSSAYGRLFLAYMPDETREGILKSLTFVKFTPVTISDLDSMREELRRVREDGYALDDGQTREDVIALAAPIFDSDGVLVAALGVSGKRTEFASGKLSELITYLAEKTLFISRQLGYNRGA